MIDGQTKQPTEGNEQPAQCNAELLDQAKGRLERQQRIHDELMAELRNVLGKMLDSSVAPGIIPANEAEEPPSDDE